MTILAKLCGCGHLLQSLAFKNEKKMGGGGILGWDGWTVFQK